MGSLSTFGTFTMARLGIYVSQHALNVTGNNISNINTKGYTRQNLDQTSMYFGTGDLYQSTMDIRSNGGVLATAVDQSRDKYLDIRYRNEMTRVGSMDTALGSYKCLSDIFDEVAAGEDGEGVLEARFNDFIQQMELLGRDESAGRDDIDFIVRDAAEALVLQFNDYANQLKNLHEQEVARFQDDIDATNTILTKIRDLNEGIRRAQIFGGSALEQRDERNLLIDDLAEKMGICVSYVAEDLGDGVEVEKLRITTRQDPERVLVDGLYATQLSMRDEESFGIDLEPLKDGKGKEMSGQPNKLTLLAPGLEITPYADPDDPAQISTYNENIAKSLATYLSGTEKYNRIDGVSYTYTAEPINATDATSDYRIKRSDGTYMKFSYDTPAGCDPDKLIEPLGVKDDAEALNYNVTLFTQAEAKELEARFNANPDFTTKDSTSSYYYHAVPVPDDGNPQGWGLHRHVVTTGAYDPSSDTFDVSEDFEFVNVHDVRRTQLTDTELTGGLQARREFLTEKGPYATEEDLKIDKDAATKRGLPYYRKALDTLANTFATMMNDANTLKESELCYWTTDASGNTIYTEKDGMTPLPDQSKRVIREEYRRYFKNSGGVFRDANNQSLGTLQDPVDFNQLVKAPGYEKYFGGNLFSNEGNSDKSTNPEIDAANISISIEWAEGRMHILPTKDPDAPADSSLNIAGKSRAQDNTAYMISMLSARHEFKSGSGGENDTYFVGKFQEMLTDTIAGTLAKDQNITNTMLKNYTAAADELYIDRDAVMGVDLNDEAMNMMQFQKAYSAACRLMTTYDDMLDRLINGTAI